LVYPEQVLVKRATGDK